MPLCSGTLQPRFSDWAEHLSNRSKARKGHEHTQATLNHNHPHPSTPNLQTRNGSGILGYHDTHDHPSCNAMGFLSPPLGQSWHSGSPRETYASKSHVGQQPRPPTIINNVQGRVEVMMDTGGKCLDVDKEPTQTHSSIGARTALPAARSATYTAGSCWSSGGLSARRPVIQALHT